jgi:3-dehydroquinate synthase class II
MGSCGEERVKLYAAVYEAIDASVALQRSLPAAQASVQRALAQLRGSKSDPEAVRQLESMSVRLHQLTAATMRPQGGGRETAVRELGMLADQWMARLPMQ